MANELAEKKSFSVMLTEELNGIQEALPDKFNQPRFVQNSLAFLNGNDSLIKFSKQYGKQGTAQILMGFVRAATLGLDAMHGECYLVPYGSAINFVTSYKGMVKMVKKYSQDPVKRVTVDVLHEGDTIKVNVIDGHKSLEMNIDPLSTKPVIGVVAECIYLDGDIEYEVMSRDELEAVRQQSKAKNSLAWSTFTEEMYKKACIRRLCKRITLDLDANAIRELDSGIEIETDQKELRNRDIEANENSEDFIEVESEVVTD